MVTGTMHEFPDPVTVPMIPLTVPPFTDWREKLLEFMLVTVFEKVTRKSHDWCRFALHHSSG